MAEATHPISTKIAVVFDFDDTLVPDTLDGLVESLGLDARKFREEQYDPLKAEGWDGIPARFFRLVEMSKNRTESEEKITKSYLARFGQQLQPFPGVADVFDRIEQKVRDLSPEIVVEFYLITSGFVEIARHTSIAKHFKAMWGCEFHYSETGEIACLKRSISYPEKPLVLYYISRGSGNYSDYNEKDLLFVHEDIPVEDLEIPLSQFIYIGDGTSDVPCFAMLNREGGTAIGVYKEGGTPEDWARSYYSSRGERVTNLAPANYEEGSELMDSIVLAIESIGKKIQLQKLSLGE